MGLSVNNLSGFGGSQQLVNYIGSNKTWWTGASSSLTVPAGTVTGDTLIIFMVLDNNNAGDTLNLPTGFTQEISFTVPYNHHLLSYKTYSSGTDGSSITVSKTGTADTAHGYIVSVTGSPTYIASDTADQDGTTYTNISFGLSSPAGGSKGPSFAVAATQPGYYHTGVTMEELLSESTDFPSKLFVSYADYADGLAHTVTNSADFRANSGTAIRLE